MAIKQTLRRVPVLRKIKNRILPRPVYIENIEPAHDQARRALNTQAALVSHIGPILDIDHPHAAYAPCEVQKTDAGRGTFFAFGGMAHAFAMPVREFFGSLSDASMNVVFVKDFQQTWYQTGLLGTTKNRRETSAFLLEHFGDLPRPWIFLGSSSGGYASIAFGTMMKADRVVAFAPQTLIDPKVYKKHHPKFVPDFGLDFDDPDNDLQALCSHQGRDTDIHIYFGAENAWDRMQAERLSGLDKVHLHEQPTDAHAVARFMRNNGTLKPALLAGLGEIAP